MGRIAERRVQSLAGVSAISERHGRAHITCAAPALLTAPVTTSTAMPRTSGTLLPKPWLPTSRGSTTWTQALVSEETT